ncbi:MAG: molybdopterin-binding protein, partial [Bauldia sp.]
MTTDRKLDRSFAKSVAPQIESLQRRLFLKRSLSVGALTMLSGCNASTPDAIERLLARMSSANDWIQGALFSPTRLAPTYQESDITKPFPFNA